MLAISLLRMEASVIQADSIITLSTLKSSTKYIASQFFSLYTLCRY